MAAIGELHTGDRVVGHAGLAGTVARVFEPLRQTPDQNVLVSTTSGDHISARASGLTKVPPTPPLRDQLIDLAKRQGFDVISWRTSGALPVTVDVFWRGGRPQGPVSAQQWMAEPPICVEWANASAGVIKRYCLDGNDWTTDDPHGVASLRYAFDLVDE